VKVSLSNTLFIRYLNQAHHQYVDLDILNR